MKRIVLIICIAFAVGVQQPLKAQFIVNDPISLIQNIINSVLELAESSATVKNTMDSFKETSKLFDQGKEYYDALKSVNNLVKDARKVQETMALAGDISSIYVKSYQKMLSDPNFTPAELNAIAEGYTKILNESSNVLKDMKTIVTGDNGLSLSDYERMDVIDKVHKEMKQLKSVTMYYTNKNISVSYLRAKENKDTQRIIALYGNPNERYW